MAFCHVGLASGKMIARRLAPVTAGDHVPVLMVSVEPAT
jgi:hypothetical protein